MSTRMHVSENPKLAGLVGLKYDEETVYSRNWDFNSLISRGIVYSGKEIVAFPFVKFFNYEEIFESDSKLRSVLNQANDFLSNNYNNHAFEINFDNSFYVTEKIDGCLGIAFFWNNEWFMKTGGDFDNFQSIWGTKKLNTHDVSKLDTEYTYLFEIVDKEEIHPLTKYYDEDIYLIGKINKHNGIEAKLDDLIYTAKSLNFRMPKIFNFNDLNEVYSYAKSMSPEHEGVVVTFYNGFKLKIKGNEFLKIQRIYHNLSKKNIFEAIKYEKSFEIDPGLIPEEFPNYRVLASDFVYELNLLYRQIDLAVELISENKAIKDMSKREIYEYVKSLFLIESKFGFSYRGCDFIDVILNKIYKHPFRSEYFLKDIRRIWLEHGVFKEVK